MLKATIVLVLSLSCQPAFARRHHDVRAFPPTPDSLLQQNAEVDRLGLSRVQTDAMLQEMAQDGELVPLVPSAHLLVECPANRALARPWAVLFIDDLSRDFYRTFHKPLRVSSAVRTVQFQVRLRRVNGNAAPATGEKASVHPAGIAVDLRRRGLTRREQRWLETRLLYWYGRGRVIVEEENRHPCFHIVVLKDEGDRPTGGGNPADVTPLISRVDERALDPTSLLHRPDGSNVAPLAQWNVPAHFGLPCNPEASR